jgi:putative addiction module component (TIGR02574 family)
MDTTLLETAIKLPFADRVALAEALWENIEEQGYEPALTLLQAAELDRRLEDYRKHPESGIPWEQVKTELERKYDKPA